LYERATAAGGGVAQTGTVNMAAILQEQGRMEEAIAMYAAVVVADPTAAQAYNNMGAALMTMGDIAAAVEALEHAVRLNPQGADACVPGAPCYRANYYYPSLP
jgi:tetratricopeptide (TPR) repeat protein